MLFLLGAEEECETHSTRRRRKGLVIHSRQGLPLLWDFKNVPLSISRAWSWIAINKFVCVTQLAEGSLEIEGVSGNFFFLSSGQSGLPPSLLLGVAPLLPAYPPEPISLTTQLTQSGGWLPSVQKPPPLWGQNTEGAYMPVGDDVGFVTHRNSILVNTTNPSSATFWHRDLGRAD